MDKKNIDYRKSVTRQITFPSRLMDVAESRARGIGYSFPEYVRFVLTKELLDEFEPMEVMVDPKEEEEIGKALKEYADGKTVSLENDKEIEDYFTDVIHGK